MKMDRLRMAIGKFDDDISVVSLSFRKESMFTRPGEEDVTVYIALLANEIDIGPWPIFHLPVLFLQNGGGYNKV